MEEIVEQILNSPIPTRLVIGNAQTIRSIVEVAIQSKFCKQKKGLDVQSCFCGECRKIKNRQHPFMLWISPEKDYSVDDMDIIFEKTRFALDDEQNFFFILDKAQNLNSASANKILKVLEEPPAGFSFILLTDNKNLILPTILSRSFIIQAQSESEQLSTHPLLKYFMTPANLPDPIIFDQELKKLKISDSESTELCHVLMEYFIQKARSDAENVTAYEKILFFHKGLTIVKMRLKAPPASGSSSMFWKLLYLDFSLL